MCFVQQIPDAVLVHLVQVRSEADSNRRLLYRFIANIPGSSAMVYPH